MVSELTCMSNAVIDKDYARWILRLKQKVQQAQLTAARNSNSVLIELYWELGREITQREKEFDYGAKFIERIASDLKQEFPNIKGFSRRNLYRIRQWYLFFLASGGVVPTAVAQLPWAFQALLVQKFKDLNIILLYSRSVHCHNWSFDTLEANIRNSYHLRVGKADHNFVSTLPKAQSDLAIETIKNPYVFDFLGLEHDAQEREIEKEIMKRITDFMLELGKGFAIVGRQYNIQISDSDYFAAPRIRSKWNTRYVT